MKGSHDRPRFDSTPCQPCCRVTYWRGGKGGSRGWLAGGFQSVWSCPLRGEISPVHLPPLGSPRPLRPGFSGVRTEGGLAVTIVELPLHSVAPPIPMTSRRCWEDPSHDTDYKDSSSSNCLHRMSVSVVHGPVSTVTRPGFPAPLLHARGHGVCTSVCRWLPRQSAYL